MLSVRPTLPREDVWEKFDTEFPEWFRHKVIVVLILV